MASNFLSRIFSINAHGRRGIDMPSLLSHGSEDPRGFSDLQPPRPVANTWQMQLPTNEPGNTEPIPSGPAFRAMIVKDITPRTKQKPNNSHLTGPFFGLGLRPCPQTRQRISMYGGESCLSPIILVKVQGEYNELRTLYIISATEGALLKKASSRRC